MPVPVTRLPLQLKPDPNRVISRLFRPGDVQRTREIVARVQAFPEDEVEQLLAGLERDFRSQHSDLLSVFADNFEEIHRSSPDEPISTRVRQLLIGAYFT